MHRCEWPHTHQYHLGGACHYVVHRGSEERRKENCRLASDENTSAGDSELQETRRLYTTEAETPLQLLMDTFSFEELHRIMKRNHNQMLDLFEEMSSFYAQLDLFKHSGEMNQ